MVIFVLFGMTVSLTMFVHDKINLQNATDLASYYVATKQAEMLGAIAHNNYQIRQSWKLLSYRYRVFSNSARTNATASGVNIRHPGIVDNWSSFYGDHSVYQPADMVGTDKPPRVCVGSAHLFSDIANVDNPCKTINFSTSYIPSVASIVGSLVGGINSGVTAANTQIAATCEAVAYIDWWFANTIYGAHKLEQRDRRAIIRALALNLAKPISPDDGMKDLEGGSVFEGARRTFIYNLSESNRRLLLAAQDKQPTIRFLNPLEGRDPSDWLKEVYVNAGLPFSHFTTSGSGCAEQLLFHNNTSNMAAILSAPAAQQYKARLDPDDRVLYAGRVTIDADDLYNVTVGVEKNPWMLVYNKAEAKVFSRPLFLGKYFDPDGIQMDAIAYSKPFGGRIGPWYNVQWPAGSDQSSGGGKTDPRLPPRVDLSSYGTISDFNDETLYPNYSKYPGDEDGLITYASMVMAGPTIGWNYTSMPTGVPPTATQDYYRAVYSYLGADYNDPLAQDFDNTSEPWDSFNRRMEIAAIAPDAFDMTYYSISPGYYDYFIEDKGINRPRLKNWLQAELPQFVELRGDLGSHNGSEDMINYDILDQLRIQDEVLAKDNGTYGKPVERSREPVEWFNTDVDAFAAMLTGWNKGAEPMVYDSADSGSMDDLFAKCLVTIVDDNAKPKIPSECLKGGRFGYSVKLISKSYIDSDQNNGGASPGNIINPL